jgi:hypothetical protein
MSPKGKIQEGIGTAIGEVRKNVEASVAIDAPGVELTG